MRVCLLILLILWTSTVAASQGKDAIRSKLDSIIDLIELSTLDTALALLNTIAEEIGEDDQELLVKPQYNKSYAFDYHGALDTALNYYNLAEDLHTDLGDVQSVAVCINNTPGACFFAGDYDQAMKYYLNCLEYTKVHGLDKTRLKALINLGVVYRVSDKFDQAIAIYRETLALSKEMNDENMVGASYHNIGVAYSFNDHTSDALIYLDSALTQYTILGDTLEMGRTSNAIGDAYYMDGQDFNKARAYLLTGESYLSKYNQQEILSNTYLTLGNIEKDLEHYEDAKYYLSLIHI